MQEKVIFNMKSSIRVATRSLTLQKPTFSVRGVPLMPISTVRSVINLVEIDLREVGHGLCGFIVMGWRKSRLPTCSCDAQVLCISIFSAVLLHEGPMCKKDYWHCGSMLLSWMVAWPVDGTRQKIVIVLGPRKWPRVDCASYFCAGVLTNTGADCIKRGTAPYAKRQSVT